MPPPAHCSPRRVCPPAVRARFAAVDTWVFDLDNTLYPAGSDLWPKIDARITRLLADLLGIDGLSARGAAEILLPALRHDAARA